MFSDKKEYSFWVQGLGSDDVGTEYIIEVYSLAEGYRELFSELLKGACEFPTEVSIRVEEIKYEHIGECARDCSCNEEFFEEDLEDVV